MKNWRVVGRENKKIEFDRVRPIPERTRHGPHGPPPRGGTPGSARLTTTGPASLYKKNYTQALRASFCHIIYMETFS